MDMKSSSITADILHVLNDGKVHTMSDIAKEVECSRQTVHKHIQSLSYRYPIETFVGGDKRGGVFLDKSAIHQGKILSRDELQIISKALRLLQESECKDVDQELLKKLIKEYQTPEKQEQEDTNQLCDLT